EGLHAEAVARGEQLLGRRIPEKECEHPDEAIQAPGAPARVGRQDDFRVAPAPVGIIRKLCAQLPVVVDLAVEDQPEPAFSVCHRLPARAGEIDDAQAVVAQAGTPARVLVGTGLGRTTMALGGDTGVTLAGVPALPRAPAGPA